MLRFLISFVLALHLFMPLVVVAQEKRKTPFDYELKWYGLVLGMALIGGFASWYSKVKKGEVPPWSIHHLTGELVTSAFAGLICFFLCEQAGSPPMLTAALTGIVGHMGTRAITLFEGYAMKRSGLQPANEIRPQAQPVAQSQNSQN